jgi:hypothetical protein
LDEMESGATKTRFYFGEVYIMRNASLQLRTGHSVNRVLECNKIYGDATGKIYLKVITLNRSGKLTPYITVALSYLTNYNLLLSFT